MKDTHYNLLSVLYLKSLKKDFSYSDNFSRDNEMIITNLYFINPKEVKDELSKI